MLLRGEQGEQVVYAQGVTFITAQCVPHSCCRWNVGSRNPAEEAGGCIFRVRTASDGRRREKRVNFTKEITASKETTPIPYVILKVLAFPIIFSLHHMCTTHPQFSF